jgi:hypothetical protein
MEHEAKIQELRVKIGEGAPQQHVLEKSLGQIELREKK